MMMTKIKESNPFIIKPSLILCIYFSFLFIHTLHIGEMKQIILGYLVSIFVVVFYFFYKQKINTKGIYVIAFFLLSFILYAEANALYIISQLKFWVYLSPLVIVPFICDSIDFNDALHRASIFTLIISITLFLVGIGVDNGYGFPRMHGLLSEPSALSLPISVVLLNGIRLKKNKYILFSLICILLTGSLMTMIIALFSYFMYLFITKRLLYRVILAIVFCIALLAIFFLIEYLVQLGSYPSISRLQQGIIYIQTLGENGHNPRFFSVLEVIYYIQENSFLYGKGINGAEHYIQATGNLRDLNLWLEMLLSFGIIGTTLFLLFLLFSIFFNKRVFSKHEAILLSSITIYCFLNSAQGIVFQSLFFIVLIQVLQRKSFDAQQNKEFIQKAY